MPREVTIAGRKVGAGHPCFVIAEAGVNHNGDLDRAFQLVDCAIAAGADAVKFQTFRAHKLASRSAPKANYQAERTGEAESQFDMLRRLELTREMHVALIEKCRQSGMLFLSTPFDEESADLLDELEMPAFKVPSGELTNLPFLRHVARKKKPMIVSTGMSYMSEVEAALRAIEGEGNESVVVLHCVSNYPAAPEDVNLRAMISMGQAFDVPAGYSDHTTGIEIALAAVALGASMIEKHFTLDRSLPGPDHLASLEPHQLRAMVQGIRSVEIALGDGRKRPAPSERNSAEVARKSLVAAADLEPGTILDRKHVAILRPGNGLSPSMLPQVVGRTLRVAIRQGDLLELEMFR